MVPYGYFAAHLKMLNVAYLLDCPMVLLNLPVLVMLLEEDFAPKGS
jgi:hypothetical protein